MKIDTSTTAGKIAVMQAYEDGKTIQANIIKANSGWSSVISSSWNWNDVDYRIKPQTIEEAAKSYLTSNYMSKPSVEEDLISMAVFGAQWQKEQDNE